MDLRAKRFRMRCNLYTDPKPNLHEENINASLPPCLPLSLRPSLLPVLIPCRPPCRLNFGVWRTPSRRRAYVMNSKLAFEMLLL